MDEPFGGNKYFAQLRVLAEQALVLNAQPMMKDEARDSQDIDRLLHEIQVHQIEMEMQNEELRRSHLALEVARDKYVHLFDFAPVGYLTLDSDGRILEANLTVAHMLGEDRKDLYGKKFHQFVAKEHQDLFFLHGRNVSHWQSVQNCELLLKHSKYGAFYARLESHATVESEETEETKEANARQIWNMVVSDVSERKEQEKCLVQSREEALAATKIANLANRAKSEFLAVMSHEIRTPLNAIMGMTEVMQSTLLDKDQQFCLEIIQRSGRNLLTLIEDILDLSHIESGRLALETKSMDFHALLQEAVDLHLMKATEKGLALTYRVEAPSLKTIDGDQKRIRQILHNLIGNALKFTDQGHVEIVVSCPSSETLVFSVIDSGIGIPEGKKKNVFVPFFQADSSNTRQHSGVGLGLTICQRLVKAMGGQLWLDSEVGKGSTFHFSIPLSTRLPMENPLSAEDDSLKGVDSPGKKRSKKTEKRCSVLLVEDVNDNASVIQEFLKYTPCQVETVVDGFQAVERIKSGWKYDLVLMDIQMPGMDGVEALRQIRVWEKGEKRTRTPCTALTAHAMQGDAQKYLQAGFDEYITKPIAKKRLLALVDRFAQ